MSKITLHAGKYESQMRVRGLVSVTERAQKLQVSRTTVWRAQNGEALSTAFIAACIGRLDARFEDMFQVVSR